MQYPKNDDHYLAITIQNRNTIVDPYMLTVGEPKNDSVVVGATVEVELKKATGVDDNADTNNGKEIVDELVVK